MQLYSNRYCLYSGASFSFSQHLHDLQSLLITAKPKTVLFLFHIAGTIPFLDKELLFDHDPSNDVSQSVNCSFELALSVDKFFHFKRCI